jgi:hypothetical protein
MKLIPLRLRQLNHDGQAHDDGAREVHSFFDQVNGAELYVADAEKSLDLRQNGQWEKGHTLLSDETIYQ